MNNHVCYVQVTCIVAIRVHPLYLEASKGSVDYFDDLSDFDARLVCKARFLSLYNVSVSQ